jgi:protein phosphatase methylesterase 1
MHKDVTPVYLSGSVGPVLFCLHGLGLSAMSFAALARELKDSVSLITFDW